MVVDTVGACVYLQRVNIRSGFLLQLMEINEGESIQLPVVTIMI